MFVTSNTDIIRGFYLLLSYDRNYNIVYTTALDKFTLLSYSEYN